MKKNIKKLNWCTRFHSSENSVGRWGEYLIRILFRECFVQDSCCHLVREIRYSRFKLKTNFYINFKVFIIRYPNPKSIRTLENL